MYSRTWCEFIDYKDTINKSGQGWMDLDLGRREA